ncbi:MAG: tRNA (adenosine(37)-N6)-threonylcarbamoyltransferase complex dimerization subunit type 1 TsaB [Candidatus Melainabacteria bacterium]|nr:tRNA (adenosine(37)-N6)-threonylcarbamoyltransferase complex dimerization subunit type 1 TsaB [Candidatus Melainabacteria bacterium]
MPCLIIDTSSELCLLALFDDGQIVAEECFLHFNNLSKALLPAIDALVAKHYGSPKQLTSIALGVGPGSYTGTRVGAAVAKSLAFALTVPLKTFSSPLAFIPDRQGTFAFLMPARSGKCFLLKGTHTATALTQEFAGLVCPEELGPLTAHADFSFSDLKPNLPVLCKYLSIAPENSELLYLHTPF